MTPLDTEAERPALNAVERRLVDALAERVVRRGLSTPAILFLESVRPMNFLASQALTFFAPLAAVALPVASQGELATLGRLLERRDSIEQIVRAIEERDAIATRSRR